MTLEAYVTVVSSAVLVLIFIGLLRPWRLTSADYYCTDMKQARLDLTKAAIQKGALNDENYRKMDDSIRDAIESLQYLNGYILVAVFILAKLRPVPSFDFSGPLEQETRQAYSRVRRAFILYLRTATPSSLLVMVALYAFGKVNQTIAATTRYGMELTRGTRNPDLLGSLRPLSLFRRIRHA